MKGLAALAVIAALLASCMPERTQDTARPTFAYTNNQGFFVVRGTDTLGSVPGYVAGKPAFTSDGRFAYVLWADKILIVDTQTGSARKLTRAYQDAPLMPVWGSHIVWLNGPDRLMGMNLADENPVPALIHIIHMPIPAVDGSDTGWWVPGVPTMVAANSETIAFTRLDHPRTVDRVPENLYVMSRDGTFTDIGMLQGLSPRKFTISPDGKTLAYLVDEYVVQACARAVIVVVDIARKTVEASRPESAVIGSKSDWLGWAADGGLLAEYENSGCGGQSIDPTPKVWRKTDGGWELSQNPAESRLELAPGWNASVVPAGKSRLEGQNHLQVDTPNGTVRIADGVDSTAAPVSRR
ncbi:hypothetical protein [Mycobacteroides franklinii]|uniref:hypothetical protein n=1 Tax=Mycobacteroides franklinii TaxID=948102 RepID=UPI0013E8ED08